MSNPLPSDSDESRASRSRLESAVRRATPVSHLVMPTGRRVRRILGIYANVFAVLIAMGLPNGALRQEAGRAMTSLDGAVRQASGVMHAVSFDMISLADELAAVPGVLSEPVDIPGLLPSGDIRNGAPESSGPTRSDSDDSIVATEVEADPTVPSFDAHEPEAVAPAASSQDVVDPAPADPEHALAVPEST